MEQPPLEMRDLIAGVIATSVTTDDQEGIVRAAHMIDAAIQKMILDMARHSHAAGCKRCGELVIEMAAARNASDSDAYDRVSNELVSHTSLEADISETEWLGGGDGK